MRDGSEGQERKREMTSKEALKDIKDVLDMLIDFARLNINEDIKKQKFEIIKKDLDLFEEYKKIEEEIGVDFITLVKMLKDDVYINDGGIVNEIGHIYKEQVKSIEHWPVWGFTAGDDDEMKTLCAFKDRGKTWALSKEEFYENIK